MLKDKISLFIPELPGYGFSSLPPKPDKRTVGNLIIEALQSVFGKDRQVIWCGHDRGARVGHRLLVDNEPSHNIKAAVLMDIVPTLEQWRAFSNPLASVAYYHWPFLATDMAPHLIETM
jgi:pimeloyl-ACP methyl ester carboxylesterase